MRLICTSARQIAFEAPLTKRSLYYAADTAMLSLGLEVDLFRQKLPKILAQSHVVTLTICVPSHHGAAITNHDCGRHGVVSVTTQ